MSAEIEIFLHCTLNDKSTSNRKIRLFTLYKTSGSSKENYLELQKNDVSHGSVLGLAKLGGKQHPMAVFDNYFSVRCGDDNFMTIF